MLCHRRIAQLADCRAFDRQLSLRRFLTHLSFLGLGTAVHSRMKYQNHKSNLLACFFICLEKST